MALLLHACCGPCAVYPVDELLSQNKDITLYWNNPNIHPEFEWNRRLENLKKVADYNNLELIIEGECLEEYWLSGEYRSRYDTRCRMCYDIRLDAAAEYAAEHGFDAFCTTLLVSPYQQHEVIIDTAKSAAARYGIEFEYHDFRPGFRQGQDKAREIGLYRQKYCGCIFSLNESKYREKILKSFEN